MRRCNRLILAVFAVGAVAGGAHAQQVTIAAGTSPSAQLAPGATLAVPLAADLSSASGVTLTTLGMSVTWSQNRLVLDSVIAGAFGSLTTNTSAAATGTLTLSASSALGATSSATIGTLYFTTAAVPGGTQLRLAPSAASDPSGTSLLPILRTRPLDVCVRPTGSWGDANDDNAVNIVDAQQIARFSVSLSVASAVMVSARGDVTNDGSVNIIDAQQIARYSVGLSAAARVNTLAATPPVVATIAVTPNAPALVEGTTSQLTGTPKDADGVDVTGCAVVSWSTSDATTLTVSASGAVNGVAGGSAAITASSGAATASVTVSVSQNRATYQLPGIDLGLHRDGSALGSSVSEASVLDMLRRLKPFAQRVRSYSMINGDQYIVTHGHALGFQVACTANIIGGANDQHEIDALNAAIDARLCDLAIVGNETFLVTPEHPSMPEPTLLSRIAEVAPHARAAGIPVTTAQTNSSYLEHRENLFPAVDVVFANFFPYWNGVPVELAIAQLHEQFQLTRAEAERAGKSVIVSESGHPSDGNAFVTSAWGSPGAVPSPVNAAKYFLSFVSWARALNVPYYFFAAFDEPAKASSSPQEAHWGLWDRNGLLKAGMQQVFDGNTLPVVSGTGGPSIQFTHVPSTGSLSDSLITGRVEQVKPADYVVAVYIKVGSYWVTKPFLDAPTAAVLQDGSWRCKCMSEPSDHDATEIRAFLIPALVRPPVLKYGFATSLPASLAEYPNAVVVP